jgi:PAS domain S-box-containing protein
MTDDILHHRASLYVTGDLTAVESEAFEVIMAFQPLLRAQVAALQEAAAAAMLTPLRPVTPPPALKTRLMGQLDTTPRLAPEAFVVTGPGGRIEWVNAAFTEMCGHPLSDLRGQKPSAVLQGPDTDSAAVARIRTALRSKQPCEETLINYHKDGTRYRVGLRILPVLDDAGQPLYYVARERKLDLPD